MEEKNIVIGLEGLVGAGKTSIAKELLNYVPNSILVHGGNVYRAIVYGIMVSGIDLKNMVSNMKNVDASQIMKKLKVEIRLEDRQTIMYIDGKKIEEENLQSKDSSIAVSKVSNIADNSKLYEFGKNIIDKYRKKYNIILSSRDIVKMYPDVTYHFFIKADIEERIKRKSIQYNGKLSKNEIKKMIILRDKLQEEAGYYKIYDKTKVIDVTDCKSVQESTRKVLDNIEQLAIS